MNPDEELNRLEHIYWNLQQQSGIEFNNAHSFHNELLVGLTQGTD